MKVQDLKSRVANVKIVQISFYVVSFAILVSGCATFQASSQLQPGRYALMRGDDKVALAHFQRAAEIDPNAAVQHGVMKEGVWTYVGRAYYAGGDYAAARKALEEARTRHPDDSLAPLYLGLALSRGGDRQKGLKEIQTGLTGLGNYYEYMEYYTSEGSYWDPGRIIRSRIEKDLAATEGKEVNWSDLIASAEIVGMEFEREADEVTRQKRKDRRDSAKGDDKGT
jgi:tetratricopeptide (TPR) repeat protein